MAISHDTFMCHYITIDFGDLTEMQYSDIISVYVAVSVVGNVIAVLLINDGFSPWIMAKVYYSTV